ncbi:MAG: LEA type 2 family protein, partial [Bacteroidetes bacterium]|nr:LEA type 2 family protein [Bacteroidota bacterium]
MKKLFLFASILPFLLSACITIKPIEFRRAENFSVSSNNNSPLLNFGLVFYNPNAFGCTITDIQSEGALKDQQVFNAGMNTKISIKSKSDFAIPVTARMAKMNFGQLLGAGFNLLLNDEAIPMKVKGRIKVRKWFISKSY